ncbi:unnamed protein product [Caretta caretta]
MRLLALLWRILIVTQIVHDTTGPCYPVVLRIAGFCSVQHPSLPQSGDAMVFTELLWSQRPAYREKASFAPHQ